MARDENGKLSLSPATLGVIIVACISAGSGGALVANRPAEASSAPAKFMERVAVLEAQTSQVYARLDRIETKLDRLLEGR